MIILIVIIILLVAVLIIETYFLNKIHNKEYKPVLELWTAIKDIDFNNDVVDMSKLDNLSVGIGVSANIIRKFQNLVDVICERINKVNEITDISEHDELSQCYNVQRLHTYKYLYEQSNNYLVVFIDVNNLKRMNDTKGHEAGDALIKKAASQIKYWENYGGEAYRIGGDEFMVVFKNVKVDHMMPAIHTWHRDVGILDVTPEGFKCLLSIGVAEGRHGMPFDIVQKVADKRMYEMKVQIKQQLGEPMR